MNDWRNWVKACEHGELSDLISGHGSFSFYCEGPTSVTATDLERLGEKRWHCVRSGTDFFVRLYECDQHQAYGCHWRLLIPIPEPQPATERT